MKERIRMTTARAGRLPPETGVMHPADQLSQSRLKDKGYKVGDVVFAEFRKPRNPQYHRFAHALGQLVCENIEGFETLGAHKAIKRLQIEANAGCDEIAMILDGEPFMYRIPQSIAFESMDESEFRELMDAICHHISETYWPDLTPEKVAEMADMMEAP